MKRVILTVALITGVIAANGQTFEVKKADGKKKGFDVESGVATGKSFEVDGKSFEVFTTKSGAKFMKLLSPKTGNHYPVWIGEDTGLKHEGISVYKFKSGSYCVYKLAATGNPYAVWLKETK